MENENSTLTTCDKERMRFPDIVVNLCHTVLYLVVSAFVFRFTRRDGARMQL